ncbi:MAG: trigger factor [Thioalkalispiraceae bacterium]|jgi:trigger factor
MQVSVESGNGLERRMTVAIEEDRISDAVEKRLKDMTRTVKMNGFRKGKVPLKVIKQQYGSQVRNEVLGEVVQSSFYEAIQQENLRPAGLPSIDTKDSKDGEGLEFTATFEVYPEVKLAPLDKATIETATCEIADQDIDEMIDTIRKQNVAFEKVDRACENGDQVNIDFTGSVDGEEFEGGKAQGHSLVLGQGKMIPGFEEGIVGAKAGEDITVDVTFPENYQAEQLAGKPAQFAIHVNSVEAPVLPEIDAEFAKKLGVEDGDLDKMREEVRANMEREMQQRLKSKNKEAVMNALIEANKIDVPAALIDNEAQALAQQMQQNLQAQGAGNQFPITPEMFKEQAERRVTLGLIMSEMVKEHDIQVDDDKVKAMVEEIAQPYEHPDEVVKWYYADKRRLSEVESMVFEDMIVDKVLSEAKTKENQVNFKDLVTPEAA